MNNLYDLMPYINVFGQVEKWIYRFCTPYYFDDVEMKRNLKNMELAVPGVGGMFERFGEVFFASEFKNKPYPEGVTIVDVIDKKVCVLQEPGNLHRKYDSNGMVLDWKADTVDWSPFVPRYFVDGEVDNEIVTARYPNGLSARFTNTPERFKLHRNTVGYHISHIGQTICLTEMDANGMWFQRKVFTKLLRFAHTMTPSSDANKSYMIPGTPLLFNGAKINHLPVNWDQSLFKRGGVPLNEIFIKDNHTMFATTINGMDGKSKRVVVVITYDVHRNVESILLRRNGASEHGIRITPTMVKTEKLL
ncbi:hypothetical protein EniLVp02_0028 [Vibrio phage EniLVp02]